MKSVQNLAVTSIMTAASPARPARRVALLLSTAFAAFAGWSPAVAADPAAAPLPKSSETTQASQNEAPDILVTARRRVENLQTTPVSATVLSGDDLLQQNIRNFQSLRGAVSNLEVLPLLSGGTSFTVRGIGQTSNQVNADAKAGFYVDGMYVARQEGNDLYFYDVASLQVLKGPQGTLFGKNTTAGAIVLTTNRPTDSLGGYLRVRGGSYKRIDTEGAINVPLAEGVSGRLSFRTQNVDGFITHVLDNGRDADINNKSVRAQVRAELGGLTVDLLGEYNQSNTVGSGGIPIGCLNTAPYVVNYNALHTVPFCTAYPVLNQGNRVYGGATLTIPTSAIITDKATGGDATSGGLTRRGHPGPFNDTSATTLNARLNYQISDVFSLQSVTAYRRSRAEFYTPTLNAPNDIYSEYDNTGTRQFTQELTLSAQALDNRLNLVAGFYYFHQKTRFLQDTGPDWIDPLGYVYNAGLVYNSYAAFGQASFKITPKLELTLGGRYTADKKSGDSYVFFAGNGATYVRNGVTLKCGYFTGDFIGGIANCAGAPFQAADSRTFHGFDPKAQVSYAFSKQLYVYGSAAHGYNAGGFNQQLGFQTANGKFFSSYNPEKLWSYEAGVKASLFDRRATINVSGFYQDYTDIQSTVLVQIGNITSRQVQSAAAAHEKGVEVEFTLRPTNDLTIRGNYSYLRQNYYRILPGATSLTLQTPVTSAPRYTFSAAVDYTFHVGETGGVTPSVDVRGIGAKPACQSGTTYTCQTPPYAIVGARIDYVPSIDSPWRVGVFGTNLFDKVTQLGRTGYNGGMGVDRYIPGRPLELGAEVQFKF